MPDRPAKRVDFIHVSIHRVVAHCCAKCDLTRGDFCIAHSAGHDGTGLLLHSCFCAEDKDGVGLRDCLIKAECECHANMMCACVCVCRTLKWPLLQWAPRAPQVAACSPC